MSQLEESREVKAFQTILVCDWIIILEIEGKCPESPNDDVSMIISEAYLDSDTECVLAPSTGVPGDIGGSLESPLAQPSGPWAEAKRQ